MNAHPGQTPEPTPGQAAEQTPEQPPEQTPQAQAQAQAQPGPDPRPRTGPIVWGVLVLAFCAYTAFQAVAPGSVDGTTFVIAVLIGLGLLLLAVGAGVIVRSSRKSRR